MKFKVGDKVKVKGQTEPSPIWTIISIANKNSGTSNLKKLNEAIDFNQLINKLDVKEGDYFCKNQLGAERYFNESELELV